MANVKEQLEALRHVGENWDNDGGAAPRPDAIDAAIRFLRPLLASGQLAEPYVTPTRAGGVLLAWDHGAHQLEVEFADGEQGSFVYLDQAYSADRPAATRKPR